MRVEPAESDAILFADRREAGRVLAERLLDYRAREGAIVLGLPRGGVPVAYEVAAALDLALDVFVVRKLGVPGHEELAMGAIASGGIRVVDERLTRGIGIDEETVEEIGAAAERELAQRERRYRGGRPAPALGGRTVLLVDDGLATGSTMRAAVRAVRSQAPAATVVAVPVAPHETCVSLRGEADDIVCLATPEPFYAVGAWYDDFGQTSDDEVRELLELGAREHRASSSLGRRPS